MCFDSVHHLREKHHFQSPPATIVPEQTTSWLMGSERRSNYLNCAEAEAAAGTRNAKAKTESETETPWGFLAFARARCRSTID